MDKLSVEERSKVMSSVRSRNTKFEQQFIRVLEGAGLHTFEYQPSGVVGRPDLVDAASRMVIFLDSCFWHGCRRHLRLPVQNREYWLKKVARNRRRDRLVTRQLKSEGWLVLRIWEHSVKDPRMLKWWLTRINNLRQERVAGRQTEQAE